MLNAFIAQQNQLQSAFLEQMRNDDPYQGTLRLACSGAVAIKLYPLLLELQAAHPGLSVQLEAAPAERIRHMLMENLTDIGITTQKFDHPVIEETLLGQESLGIILPATSQIASGDFEALSALGYIHHPDGKHYADLVLGLNFPAQYKGVDGLPHRGYVNQLTQILLPVAKGLGFTVLPESVVSHDEARDALRLLSLQSPVSQSLYLSKKKHRDLPKRFEAVLDIVHQAIGHD